MRKSIIHEEVRVIQEWLNKDCYKIDITVYPYYVYCFNALKEYNSYIFDLEIEYDYYKKSILLKIIYLGEIDPDKYSLCLELLNYLNIYYLFYTFF